jgi:chromosomal replication initiation ATPase DnaA
MYKKKEKNKLNDSQVNLLIEKVSNYFDTPVEDVIGKCRKDKLVKTRMYICALLKLKHKMTLKKIGEHLSNRDHTSIIYMLSEYENKVNSKLTFIRNNTISIFNNLDEITKEI